jgi:hypothetical protein
MAYSTNTVSQSSGVVNKGMARLVADAVAAVDQVHNFGFVPRYVKFVNITDRITLEWYEGMAANSAIRTVAAGTQTLDVASGITVYGTNTAAQAAGKQLGDILLKAADVIASKTFTLVAEA